MSKKSKKSKKAKIPYCDYTMALDDFAKGLIKLHNHIEQHDLIPAAENVCDEIKAAVTFLKCGDDYIWVEHDAAWVEGWAFIGDCIRGWWD